MREFDVFFGDFRKKGRSERTNEPPPPSTGGGGQRKTAGNQSAPIQPLQNPLVEWRSMKDSRGGGKLVENTTVKNGQKAHYLLKGSTRRSESASGAPASRQVEAVMEKRKHFRLRMIHLLKY